MTVLDDAIRVGCMLGSASVSCGYPSDRCREYCGEFPQEVEAALRTAIPRDPTFEMLHWLIFGLRHGADQRFIAMPDDEAKDIALAAYRALPIWRDLHGVQQ